MLLLFDHMIYCFKSLLYSMTFVFIFRSNKTVRLQMVSICVINRIVSYVGQITHVLICTQQFNHLLIIWYTKRNHLNVVLIDQSDRHFEDRIKYNENTSVLLNVDPTFPHLNNHLFKMIKYLNNHLIVDIKVSLFQLKD